ncbi:MAG: energy-coupling factor ABC transporter permease [Candidatus Flexifilum sp.]|jgi:cobalt/nickel transport system permease protein
MIPPILALHIPDGFLNLPVSLFGWVLLIPLLGYALLRVRQGPGERHIALMGVLAAFVFAAQMLNFPVAGGTSGHLLGAVLVAILIGPWAMMVVMTSVIGVQALLFQDGGLLALGFNVINMGVLSGLVGYTIYGWINGAMGRTFSAQLIGAGIGAWAAVVAVAAATALELAASGTSPLEVALPAMVSVHVLIGIGEALITVAALAFVQRTRPDLIDGAERADGGSRWIAIGFALALLLAFAAPLADPNPDGLERVAADHGFIDAAQEPPYTILPDYTVPFIESEIVTTIVAGIIGVIFVGALSLVAARLTSRRTPDRAQESDPTAAG